MNDERRLHVSVEDHAAFDAKIIVHHRACNIFVRQGEVSRDVFASVPGPEIVHGETSSIQRANGQRESFLLVLPNVQVLGSVGANRPVVRGSLKVSFSKLDQVIFDLLATHFVIIDSRCGLDHRLNSFLKKSQIN